MSRAFIVLKNTKRIYKLNTKDIAKLYKVIKMKFPTIPSYEERCI
jgi:hypothetical protein